jgi:hypothetical protein
MARTDSVQAAARMIPREPTSSRVVDLPFREPSVSTEIYWMLPGPRGLIDAVTSVLASHPVVMLRVPAIPIAGLATALETALHRIYFDNVDVRWLKLGDGMSLPTEIGSALGGRPVPPEQLGTMKSPIRTIVLEALTNGAVLESEEYLASLAASMAHTHGDFERPRVLALLPQALDAVNAPISHGPQEIIFSGALNPPEIAAYVAVRMIERSAPGGTGLLRMLVTEFAGFDAKLAEELIALSDETLLGLPRCLEAIAARSDQRWRSGRWAAGCWAEIGGQRVRHTLHEMHLSQHTGPDQRDASEWLRRRYWRACVRTLLPWLEERRSSVIGAIRAALEQHLKSTGHMVVRSTPNGRRIETAIDDLEYNQIPGLIYNDQFKVPNDLKMRRAVEVCYAAKAVRDEIAHMRAPSPSGILDVTGKMELFFSI